MLLSILLTTSLDKYECDEYEGLMFIGCPSFAQWRSHNHRSPCSISFDNGNSTSSYRSWYSISICIWEFVVYWVVIMIPILFIFLWVQSYFRWYPKWYFWLQILVIIIILILVVFLWVQSYFLQRPKYSFPVSARPKDEHVDILDWDEDIISINMLDTQQSMPNDENKTSHWVCMGIQRNHRHH